MFDEFSNEELLVLYNYIEECLRLTKQDNKVRSNKDYNPGLFTDMAMLQVEIFHTITKREPLLITPIPGINILFNPETVGYYWT